MNYFLSGNENKYDIHEKKFQIAFDFIKREGLADLPECTIDLGEGVKASIQHYITSPKTDIPFETHEHFIDLQYMIEGEEMVGCCAREGLAESVKYDAERDITFYFDPELYGMIYLRKNEFVLLMPEDAHKPRCIAKEAVSVKKIVVKIPV